MKVPVYLTSLLVVCILLSCSTSTSLTSYGDSLAGGDKFNPNRQYLSGAIRIDPGVLEHDDSLVGTKYENRVLLGFRFSSNGNTSYSYLENESNFVLPITGIDISEITLVSIVILREYNNGLKGTTYKLSQPIQMREKLSGKGTITYIGDIGLTPNIENGIGGLTTILSITDNGAEHREWLKSTFPDFEKVMVVESKPLNSAMELFRVKYSQIEKIHANSFLPDTYNLQGRSIVVLAARNDIGPVSAALSLEKYLAETGDYKILSSNEIRFRFPAYPATIAPEIPDWIDDYYIDERARGIVTRIAAEMNADFAIIIDSSSILYTRNGGLSNVWTEVIGNIIDASTGQCVGFIGEDVNKGLSRWVYITPDNTEKVLSIIEDNLNKLDEKIEKILFHVIKDWKPVK